MSNKLSKKISILIKEGMPKKQAIAIALSMQTHGRIGPKGEYIRKKRRSPKKKKRRSPKKKRRSPKKKRRSPKKKRRSPKKKRRSPKKKKSKFKMGGCYGPHKTSIPYQKMELAQRNLSIRHKKIFGNFPPSRWDPCESCDKCYIRARGQGKSGKGFNNLTLGQLGLLAEDCAYCTGTGRCKTFDLIYRHKQLSPREKAYRLRNISAAEQLKCRRQIERAELLQKFLIHRRRTGPPSNVRRRNEDKLRKYQRTNWEKSGAFNRRTVKSARKGGR